MTTVRRRRKAKRFPLWVLWLAPIGMFGVLWLINQSNRDFQANSELMGVSAQHQVRQAIESELAKAQAARAIERYQNGACFRTPEVKEGLIFDLPVGSVVCGPDGTTGAIGANGEVTDLAYTSDTSVVRTFLGW